MVASLTSSCLTMGSHCSCLRIGVTWSNFLVPETIRAVKFCTVCNSSMFFLVVLAHTNEQYSNLLNTRELIMVINVRLSNRCFTRFIWQRLAMHFEVNWVICSSWVYTVICYMCELYVRHGPVTGSTRKFLGWFPALKISLEIGNAILFHSYHECSNFYHRIVVNRLKCSFCQAERKKNAGEDSKTIFLIC